LEFGIFVIGIFEFNLELEFELEFKIVF